MMVRRIANYDTQLTHRLVTAVAQTTVLECVRNLELGRDAWADRETIAAAALDRLCRDRGGPLSSEGVRELVDLVAAVCRLGRDDVLDLSLTRFAGLAVAADTERRLALTATGPPG